MLRRAALVTAGLVGGLALLVVAALAAILASRPGHLVARRLLVGALERAVDGRVHVGAVGGPLWRGADLTDVELDTPGGRPVLRVARLSLHYDPATLLRGRVRLSGVTLVRPVVLLEEGADGRLTLARLFHLGDTAAAAPGPRPVIELTNVRVTDGTVILRLPAGGGKAGGGAGGRGAATQERRFDDLDLRLDRLRVSDPGADGVLAVVRHLAVRVSDPAVRLTDAAGRVLIAGDSVSFDLTRVALPGSAGAARGTVRWGVATRNGGRPTLDLAASLTRVDPADFRWAVRGLPAGAGRIVVRGRRWPDGASQWAFRGADITADGSRVRGAASLSVGPGGGAVRLDTLDVELAPLRLAALAPFAGAPLPLAGAVAGHLQASGPLAALRVRANLAFTDAAVAGNPTSRVAGSGVVALGGPSGFAFHHFALTGSNVALATLSRLAPAVSLHGRLEAAGELDGPWADAAFRGALVHRDGDGPASTLRGTVRLSLKDTVAVDADVVADSLSLDDLRKSYPALPLAGAVTGRLRLAGPLRALTVDAALSVPNGEGGGAGGVTIRGEIAVRDAGVRLAGSGSLDSLDVAGLVPGAPPTRLTGRWSADVTLPAADTAPPATGSLALTLAAGQVAHLPLRQAVAKLRLTADRLDVDTVFSEQPGLRLGLSGTLGRPGRAGGELRFAVTADTLANLAPLLAWARRAGGDSAAPRLDLRGAGRLTGRVDGTLAIWQVTADLAVDSVAAGPVAAVGLEGRGSVARTARGYRIDAQATADSVTAAGMRYAAVEARVTGLGDSTLVHLGARFRLHSSVAVDVGFKADTSGWAARLRDGVVVLRGRPWVVAGHPRIRSAAAGAGPPGSGAGAVAFDTLELRAEGGGRIRLAGQVPGAAAGDVLLALDSVPLPDLAALIQRDTAGLGGLLSATVRVEGTAARPAISAHAAVAGLRYGDFRTSLVEATADYAERRLHFDARLGEPGAPAVTASGSLPLDLALGAVAQRQLPGPLEIRARADSMDLSIVDAWTALVRDAGGRLTADVTVGGTWERPALGGSIRVLDGAATVPALGASYHGIEARLALAADSLRVEQAVVRGQSGTLEIGGAVHFRSLTRPVLDLTLRARSFAAFNERDFAGLTASGGLTLAGPLLGATLSGQCVVDAGYLRFADLVEKRIVNLDDPEFQAVVDSNLAQAADLGPSAPNVFLDSLRIRDLKVTMGPDVWLRSDEANIQLAGSFTVAKTVEAGASRYRLDGTLQAPRGTYRLVVGPTAKDFRVTRGTVRFYGTPDFDPALDIAAEHTVRAVSGSDVVIQAVIGGTLLVPKLTLESDQRPPLSESEIVSYLLFGRPSFDLASGGGSTAMSTSEQAVLQGAMAGLAGMVSGELEQTLVTSFGLPVDYIAIRPGAGSVGDMFTSARVEAGTQLGERTFLSVNAGLCQVTRGLSSQALGASLEHRLSGGWSLEASVEPTLQECRPAGFQIRPPAPYQIGFDVFWRWGGGGGGL